MSSEDSYSEEEIEETEYSSDQLQEQLVEYYEQEGSSDENEECNWDFIWDPELNNHVFQNRITGNVVESCPFEDPGILSMINDHRIFKLLDADSSNTLSFDELRVYLSDYLTEGALLELFEIFDEKGHGEIEFEEFFCILEFMRNYGVLDDGFEISESDEDRSGKDSEEEQSGEEDQVEYPRYNYEKVQRYENEERQTDDSDEEQSEDEDQDEQFNGKHYSKHYGNSQLEGHTNKDLRIKVASGYDKAGNWVGSAEAKAKWEGTGSFSSKGSLGEISGSAKLSLSAGAKGELKTEFDEDGDWKQSTGKASVSTKLKAKAESHYNVAGLISGNASGSASTYAEAKASGSVSKTHLEGKVGAFAGASAEGKVDTDLEVGGKKIGSFNLSGKAIAGAGAGASGNLGYKDGTLRVGCNLGVAVGAGASAGFNIEVNPKELCYSAGKAILKKGFSRFSFK